MRVLALDTTTRAGSVAVARDDEILAVIEGNAARTHGERLPSEIDAVLRAAAVTLTDIDLFAVASGPGAFTGLRIGLAAIQGLAMVIARPVIGVSALDALAWSAIRDRAPGDATLIATWMDAQRGEVFSATYEVTAVHDSLPNAIAGPDVGLPASALESVGRHAHGRVLFVGDGAQRHRPLIAAHDGCTVDAAMPLLAPAIAQIGRRLAAAGHAGPPHLLKPLYVRRPDAELERMRQSG